MGKVTVLTREFSPEKEDYEKLGFVFNEVEGEPGLYLTELPEGWKIKETKFEHTKQLIDDADNVRGEFYFEHAEDFGDRMGEFWCEYWNHDKIGLMRLDPYYRIRYSGIDIDNGNYVSKVVFGTGDEEIFSAGEIDFKEYCTMLDRLDDDKLTSQDRNNMAYALLYSSRELNKETTRLIEICKAYGDEMFPGWDKVDSYWPDKYDKAKVKRG